MTHQVHNLGFIVDAFCGELIAHSMGDHARCCTWWGRLLDATKLHGVASVAVTSFAIQSIAPQQLVLVTL